MSVKEVVKLPTLDHIRAALKIAKKGSHKYKGIEMPVEFDQGSWCGTSCCVWGHAMLLAGNTKIVTEKDGERADDFATTQLGKFAMKGARHRALQIMMGTFSDDVLPVLRSLVGKRPVEEVLEKASNEEIGVIAAW